VGLYFVTICTHGRRPLFGEIINEAMQLNQIGSCIADEWVGIPNSYMSAVLHEFVVMPNHLHGIIELLAIGSGLPEGAMNCAPTLSLRHESFPVGARFIAPSDAAPTLGQIVRGFKARCTVALRKEFSLAMPIWQRNYHEHVIRNESSLQAIREYIANNPAQWALDKENPAYSSR
jgi:REP element-mobilizing transposase RayT